MAAAVACGRSDPPKVPGTGAPPPEPTKPDPLGTVQTTSGSADRFSEGAGREHLWTVRWESARLDFTAKGLFGGRMERVSGDIREKGKVVAKFEGKEARASKADNLLSLEGGVRVVSTENGSVLRCDKVEYRPEKKVVRAVGGVRIVTESGTIDAGDEVLATPDLRHVATPNLFKP